MEQPLPAGFSCNLGSINLNEFVLYPYTEHAAFNLKDFKNAVRIGVEALDAVIDENADNHPLKEQKENSLNYRNIGLGVMGYANMLMKMGYEYGSNGALAFTKALFQTMFREAIWASYNLAKKNGVFPKYSDKIFESTIVKECLSKEFINTLEECGLRNCSLLSIAPTGSISTMLGVSGGIEPEFALSYQRKTESLNDGKDKYYTVYCNSVNEYKEVNPRIETLPECFISAMEIPWKRRVDTQAAIQNFVDTAISSTVNLPTEATLGDVENLYLYAWQKGIKGITIYRSGCKREGILTTNTPKPEQTEEKAEELENLTWGMTLQLSDDLIGKKRKIMSGCGSIHVSGWFDPVNGRLLEVFLSKGSSGGCNAFMTSDSRMISLALRTGADFDMVMDQLKSVPSCPSYSVRNAVYKDCSKGNNCSSAIANALIEMHNEIKNELFDEEEEYSIPAGRTEAIEQKKEHIKTVKVVCPECGADLQFAEGCNSCSSCGYSACS
jgi:ribonucleoside-diphosphate reductase alpha chain